MIDYGARHWIIYYSRGKRNGRWSAAGCGHLMTKMRGNLANAKVSAQQQCMYMKASAKKSKATQGTCWKVEVGPYIHWLQRCLADNTGRINGRCWRGSPENKYYNILCYSIVTFLTYKKVPHGSPEGTWGQYPCHFLCILLHTKFEDSSSSSFRDIAL